MNIRPKEFADGLDISDHCSILRLQTTGKGILSKVRRMFLPEEKMMLSRLKQEISITVTNRHVRHNRKREVDNYHHYSTG